MIEQSWDNSRACFLYRDRDSHISTSSEFLGKRSGAGVIEIHRDFHPSVRPTFQIISQTEGTRPVQIYIHGTSTNGAHRVDHISNVQVHWHLNIQAISRANIYINSIEHIEVTGLLPSDELIVHTSV